MTFHISKQTRTLDENNLIKFPWLCKGWVSHCDQEMWALITTIAKGGLQLTNEIRSFYNFTKRANYRLEYKNQSFQGLCFLVMENVLSAMCYNACSRPVSGQFVQDCQRLGFSQAWTLLRPSLSGTTRVDDLFIKIKAFILDLNLTSSF